MIGSVFGMDNPHLLSIVLFGTAAISVFYILAGYPMLVALWARLFPRPVRRNPQHTESVTVVIAVRNGAFWLARKLDSVLAQEYPEHLLDVLVVSDGSTDGTDEIAASYAARGVRMMRVVAGGKPAALNAAIPQTRGDLLLLTDVRQVLRADCLRRLVSSMADPQVGVVSGNLRIMQGTTEEEENTALYWRYENWIRGNLAKIDSMIGATGPVNLIRRSLYVPIPDDSLLDDVYLPMSIHLAGYRLVLDPDAVAFDEPTGLRSEFWRKVRTQAGILQLLATFPGLFSGRNRVRLPFVSLKIGRLLLPFLLALLFVSAWMLPAPWNLWTGIPQAAFWGLALVDRLFPSGSGGKRITALPSAVAVLTWAAFCAWKILFVPPQELWVDTRPPGALGPSNAEGRP